MLKLKEGQTVYKPFIALVHLYPSGLRQEVRAEKYEVVSVESGTCLLKSSDGKLLSTLIDSVYLTAEGAIISFST
jgi:hypothetical protein